MAKILKKRSSIDAAARTIERRRRAKRSSTGASPPPPPTISSVDVRRRNRLPPAERALFAAKLARRTTFERCREHAGHSSNAEKITRLSLFFLLVGYNKRYPQHFQVSQPVIFDVDGDAPPHSGRFWKKVRQNR